MKDAVDLWRPSGRRSSAIRSCAGDRHGHAGRWAAWLMVPIGARALSVARTRPPRRFLASDGHFGDTVLAVGRPAPWWAHFEFTRINTTPTILPKKFEEQLIVGVLFR